MKTDEEILLNVINHMNNLALFATDNADQYVLTGAQIEKLSDSQIAKYEEGVVWLLTQLAHQTENASLQGEFESNDMVSLKIFQYIFDRSIEALYYVIKGEDPSNIVFDLNEVGDYYELSIPIDTAKSTGPTPELLSGENFFFVLCQTNLNKFCNMDSSAIGLSR